MESCDSPSISTFLRPDWLYALVRECQLVAAVVGSTWGPERAAAVENFIRRTPRPESPLERFFLRAVIGEVRWRAALSPAPASGRQIHVSDPRLGRALKIIETRRTDIALSQRGIAADVGLSGGHLGRLFRAHIGCGVRTCTSHTCGYERRRHCSSGPARASKKCLRQSASRARRSVTDVSSACWE